MSHGLRWTRPSLFRVEVIDHARLRVRGERRWIEWRAGLTRLDADEVLAFVRARALTARIVREATGEVVDGEGASQEPLLMLGPGGDFVTDVHG